MWVSVVLMLASTVPSRSVQQPNRLLHHLADRFVDQQLLFDPTLTYSTGLAVRDHSHFADRSPRNLARHVQLEHEDLKVLLSIPVSGLAEPDRAMFANLREQLEADLQLQVCRTELWNVNHFDGWQSHFAEVAQEQPVLTTKDRLQALERWGSLSHYLEVEIANLTLGQQMGYSAPQSVVRRVIQQMSALAVSDPEQSVFYSPGRRSNNPAFQASFRRLIEEQINPALLAYRDFLQVKYLPRAREGTAISDLPNGVACYRAFLRASTTLQRTPQGVFNLGEETVRGNTADIVKIGEMKYHSKEVPIIVAAIRNNPAEQFKSAEELLAFSKRFLERARDTTAADLIASMPRQNVVIRSLPAFEEQSGVGSRFQQEPDPSKPAVYLIRLSDWKTETRTDAEIVTVHETMPGHYLQKALARQLRPPTRLSKLIQNDAYVEGWARYAEAMGEEAKIYDTDDASIMRRLWPARGLVVDPGLNALHWTRQQAIDYMVSSGHFTPEVANDYVDRIAVMPGQLTSYDSGSLEIRRLRSEAEAKLGQSFHLREFNRVVLEEGVVPLAELQRHVEAWLAREMSSKRTPSHDR